MDKPYLLRPWEIERLTDKQIIELYYRKRDDKGSPIPYDGVEHEWVLRTRKSEKAKTKQMLDDVMSIASLLGGDTKGIRETFVKKHGDPYSEGWQEPADISSS